MTINEMVKGNGKTLSADQVLDRMAKYCAYQERCVKDASDKLKSYDISQQDRDSILAYLIDNRFIDDARFARSFVRGKINQSHWGLNKIRFHLHRKGIAKEIIDEAMRETDGDLYRQQLVEILKTKAKSVKADNPFKMKQKLAAYAMQKGFEPELVWETLKEVLPNQ